VPVREAITLDDYCAIAARWQVDEATMLRVAIAAADYLEETRGTIQIISGYRSTAEQNALRSSGRPAAANDRSTHLSCPATGVDVSLGFAPTRAQIATWGRLAVFAGLRWGGGGSVDPGGIPDDWQHVDMGPRA